MTNPPFTLALEFCDHAIKHSDYVFMLLRLNFLGAQCRYHWHKEHPLTALFVLSQRPSFTSDGHTDSIEYGWFHWARYPDNTNIKGVHHLAPC